MICRKDFENKKEKENTRIYNFQGQYSGSILWFDIDHEWLEEYFRTHELDFYKKLYKKLGVKRQKHILHL